MAPTRIISVAIRRMILDIGLDGLDDLGDADSFQAYAYDPSLAPPDTLPPVVEVHPTVIDQIQTAAQPVADPVQNASAHTPHEAVRSALEINKALHELVRQPQSVVT